MHNLTHAIPKVRKQLIFPLIVSYIWDKNLKKNEESVKRQLPNYSTECYITVGGSTAQRDNEGVKEEEGIKRLTGMKKRGTRAQTGWH